MFYIFVSHFAFRFRHNSLTISNAEFPSNLLPHSAKSPNLAPTHYSQSHTTKRRRQARGGENAAPSKKAAPATITVMSPLAPAPGTTQAPAPWPADSPRTVASTPTSRRMRRRRRLFEVSDHAEANLGEPRRTSESLVATTAAENRSRKFNRTLRALTRAVNVRIG